MEQRPQELVELLEAVPSLEDVQQGFDTYQVACFVQKPPEFFALELCGEAGELANLEKKSWKGKEVSADHFEDEAADVFIALMNYCNARGIHLGKAVANKLVTIEERRQEGKM